METLADGTIVEIRGELVALGLLDQQPCEREHLYGGYLREEWETETEPSYYVIQTKEGWYLESEYRFAEAATVTFDEDGREELTRPTLPCVCNFHPSNAAQIEVKGDAYKDWS